MLLYFSSFFLGAQNAIMKKGSQKTVYVIMLFWVRPPRSHKLVVSIQKDPIMISKVYAPKL